MTITAALVVSLPLLPFSLGTYELAIAGVLALLGVNNSAAAAYALASHLITIALSLVTGLPAMIIMGFRFRALVHFGEAEREATVDLRDTSAGSTA